ncbi:DotU family type IV/VI secretion system protein [Terriglobus saanensis]|uniref:Type IV / VI secretion system protein, DotU family n=1 Tax=Terriglobus saanensis (strain ATCC BAA-1853 / DSM 23119 / SP1PR4) TaxID=401053 RepID=E8UX22_TERSS|nr:DotU family type IV/VI secretion system protein [Terriglobus saanensis]ADV81909.1 type IV / VI secretion system protein, DotU family [Terriglobus saanensis SP1PR4]
MNSPRAASLASAFQEVFTAIVRVRFRLQRVENASAFRDEIRQSLQHAMQQARSLGYTNEGIQVAVFATVAFLDESVLNVQDPVFADWAGRPLQEELFGGHLAGEAFFQNLRTCLGQQDSSEVADVLEIHCLCLLIGYRGRYALGDSGELHALLRQARERIRRIRGDAHLGLRPNSVPPALAIPTSDTWTRRLAWTVCFLSALVFILFVWYEVELSSGLRLLQRTILTVAANLVSLERI